MNFSVIQLFSDIGIIYMNDVVNKMSEEPLKLGS